MNNKGATVRVMRPSASDLPAVLALLRHASLPEAGVEDHFDSFLVAERRGEIVGAIGLELYDDTALLRSAVVDGNLRNMGIGSMLYDQLLRTAGSAGVKRLILFTGTAGEYFRKKGFVTIDAATVTGPIRSSAEFTGACPSSAACMEKFL